MSNKPIQKAWQINLNRIDEGYLYSDAFCYAETRNKAKLKLLGEFRGMVLKYSSDEMTYITIPVIRDKSMDKYEFNGELLTKYQIEHELMTAQKHKNYDLILSDNSITHCYIMKRGSYYRSGSCGYTEMKHRAGVFTKQEAISEGKSVDELTIIPINNSEHNYMINEEINKLKTRLL